MKEKFSATLGVKWIAQGSSDFSPDERKPLREFTIQSPDEESTLARLKAERRYPGTSSAGQPDLIFAEVVQFCPIPLPEYQRRSRQVIEERVQFWRGQLQKLRSGLKGAGVYTVPFGRFLLDETERSWVSDRLMALVPPEEYFNGWQVGDAPLQEVHYFRRPFILWPATNPQSAQRSVRLPRGDTMTLVRPLLDHPLFSEEMKPVKQAEPRRGWPA